MGRTVFFAEANNGLASCVISNKSVAVLKEYNLRRHYNTKHRLKYSNCPPWCISYFLGFVFLFVYSDFLVEIVRS